MLDRILKLHESVTRVLVKRENEHHFHKNLEKEEIQKIRELCDILEPFYIITVKLSTENYATLSLILPSIYVLNKTGKIS